MIRKFIVAFVLSFFVMSSSAFAADEPKIQAVGIGVPPKNFNQNDSFAKTFARQAARMDALRQLAEYIGGVYVEDDKKNPNIKKVRTAHDSKMFELITNHARVIKIELLDGGRCAVTMEVKCLRRVT